MSKMYHYTMRLTIKVTYTAETEEDALDEAAGDYDPEDIEVIDIEEADPYNDDILNGGN